MLLFQKTGTHVDSNKTTLFSFVADQMKSLVILKGKVLISTKEENVVLSNNCTYFSTDGIEPCNHEEAYTRLLLHCKHAYDQRFRKLLIAATDSDVVVIYFFLCSACWE